uniref:Uncharacterized protein n=1 Tax=Physcomitrium patens TaxID=3218 RepID=A0A2K1IW39_PHYPA|nr:hypothetical protein PHYPA_025440 [Physcomitrium patens]
MEGGGSTLGTEIYNQLLRLHDAPLPVLLNNGSFIPFATAFRSYYNVDETGGQKCNRVAMQ